MNFSCIARVKRVFLFLLSLVISCTLNAHDLQTVLQALNFAQPAIIHHDAQALKPYLTPHNQELYTAITQEIEQLKRYSDQHPGLGVALEGEIFFTLLGRQTEAVALAPQTFAFLRPIIHDICTKGGIPMPDIALHLSPSGDNTVNQIAYNAYAVSAISPNYIAIDEELLKLFLWNKKPKELLHAILAHELGHIKFSHQASTIKNEHQADSFAVSILEKPTMLLKSLDLTILAGSLYFSLYQNTSYPIATITGMTRALANYAIDAVPKLGTLRTAKTNKAFVYIINIITRNFTRGGALSHGHDVILDLTNVIKHTFTDKHLMKDVNNQFHAYVDNETHPSPFARRRYIKACIKAKKLGHAFPVVQLAYIDDMMDGYNPGSLEDVFEMMEQRS